MNDMTIAKVEMDNQIDRLALANENNESTKCITYAL
jgi:hypothetical protein